MAQDQEQLMKVFGSLMQAKGESSDPAEDYYRQREKYEKRRMISSIFAPIAGQFLGNLVAAPFREPVQDFLKTSDGRELYGQWRNHDLLVGELANATEDIKKYDGSRSDYFYDRVSNYTNEQLVEALGEDWHKDFQGPQTIMDSETGELISQKASPVRGIYGDVMDHVRRVAKIEEAEYLEGIEYYKNFPTYEQFITNVERYGPRSSNFGQALFRKLKRAFTGQSREDYIDQSILNITGVNAHIFAQKVDEKPDSDYWSMDVETLQEGMSRVTGAITPEVLDPIIQEAIEKYWATPTGTAKAFENKLALNERESANNLYIMYRSGEMPPSMEAAYIAVIQEREQGAPLPSMGTLNAKIMETLKDFVVDLPDNDDIINSIIVGENFTDFMDGKEGRPGLNRSLWALQFEGVDDRQIPVWIDDLGLEGNLEYYINENVLTSTQATAFKEHRNIVINELINAGKGAMALTISEANRTGLEMPAINNPLTRKVFQRELLLQTIKGLTDDYMERGDTTIYQDQSFDVLFGFAPNLLRNAMTGKVFQGENISNRIELSTTQAESEALDLDGMTTSEEPEEEETTDTDEQIDIGPITEMPVTTRQDQINIVDRLANTFQTSYKEAPTVQENYQERVRSAVSTLNSLTPDQINIFKTSAFNYRALPFYRMVEKVANSENPAIFPLTNTDGLVLKVTPSQRLRDDKVLIGAEANAGGRFLQFTVGRMETPEVPGIMGPKPPPFMLGGSEPKEPDKEFVGLAESYSKQRNAIKYDNLPPALKEYLGVISEASYVPLLRELKELGVKDVDSIPGRTPETYVTEGGAYKGNTDNEKRISEIRAALEIMFRSIGAPGSDTAGVRGTRLPLSHTLLIAAYNDNNPDNPYSLPPVAQENYQEKARSAVSTLNKFNF